MPGKIKNEKSPHDDILEEITSINIIMWTLTFIYNESKNDRNCSVGEYYGYFYTTCPD